MIGGWQVTPNVGFLCFLVLSVLGAIHKRRPQKSGDFRPPSPPLSEFVHIRLTPPLPLSARTHLEDFANKI